LAGRGAAKRPINSAPDRPAELTQTPEAPVRFLETDLDGARLIDPEPAHDERGFFSRTFCAREFAAQGLETIFVQHSLSSSSRRGTLRGMHFQRPPHGEVKLVECARGAIWDVIIDLRPASPSFGRWQAFELNDENRRQLYIPKGFAHGFQSLSDAAEVRYLISEFYEPSAASGVRHDDPAFAIPWPLPVTAISPKDKDWPDYVSMRD
jgi:dTDP-4-dehydrorhamnose 3,5-epimerase